MTATTNRTAVKMYQCSICGEVHEGYWTAEECCPPEVDEVWLCPECEEIHGTEDEALACCPPAPGEPLSLGAYRKLREELEAAGQTRLFE